MNRSKRHMQATEEAWRRKLAVEVSKIVEREEQVTLISTVVFFQRA